MPRATADVRADVARYYDVSTDRTADIAFYRKQVEGKQLALLELGCGTGRVLSELAPLCERAVGVDNSESMLEVCESKILGAGLGDQVRVVSQDLAELDVGERFDLIIAPFRVLQNVESEEHTRALLEAIHVHLSPEGACIVDVFQPNAPAEELVATWESPAEETEVWQRPYEDGVLQHSFRRSRIRRAPLTLYPELIYRFLRAGQVVDKSSVVVPMRVYYPAELVALVERSGFRVTDRWGGYDGEEYGAGRELVLKFQSQRVSAQPGRDSTATHGIRASNRPD